MTEATGTRRSARRVLVVDDEAGIRRALRSYLADEGFEVDVIEDGAGLVARVAEHPPDLVLLDLVMPELDGLSALAALRQKHPEMPVIMMSGQASVERAVEATRLGAYDFLEKPLTPEKVLVTVARALEFHRLRGENEVLRAERSDEFRMVGSGPASREIEAAIDRVAPSSGKVLILGENGTGKELVARAIHERSERRQNAFVRVNCAAIPRDLVESELFGHEKGAFTGATQSRRGKFELADGGTLFLDEVGETSPEAQAKLLRALEQGEAERVGGAQPIRFDVRVIAATNRDLQSDIDAGRFRRDLYYRLSVVPIQLRPLRERQEDITLLAEHFLARYCIENTRPPIRADKEALALLTTHEWPGNIRELRNLMERIAIMHEGNELTGDDVEVFLPDVQTAAGAGGGGDSDDGTLKVRLGRHEHQIILLELDRCSWNVSAAAKTLGIDRASLHRKMKRHGIARETRGA